MKIALNITFWLLVATTLALGLAAFDKSLEGSKKSHLAYLEQWFQN